MDFKRIEIIFLCAFLTLNIFLLTTFKQGNGKDAQRQMNSQSTIESRLKKDKITYQQDFSERKHGGYYLSGETTYFKKDNETLDVKVGESGPGKLPVSDDPKKDIEIFLKNNNRVTNFEDYQYYLKAASTPERKIMAQGFEEVPFFDETAMLEMEVTEADKSYHSFGKFTQSHIDNIEPLREKQEAVSEKEAIETLYIANKIPYEGKIKETLLGYSKIFTVRGKNVYIPTWFVWLEDEKKNSRVERVNAFANTVFTANISDVKESE
ncbi:hypothetical protein G7081_01005 [Vagococcus coleopterorum]|uniref:Regulatory protein YycH-like domain-containing protein n=1 Tax=Vagococcus coleopterorum TaxID=2714946 RepID=A0A6G8ALA1_9ENTE|nr:two-component system regulatory protein YycI [Vagococcus coleopterorum]QIL45767.1 hypothetical protein G7081_01005 [Vagococcus coleopterorum]